MLPRRSTPVILVVDDEVDVRDFVTMVLEDAGWAVEGAGDGREALDKMPATRPDLVVLDLMMPVMDGWEVLDRLKHVVHPPVVVILSAYADSARALKAGAADCLAKPFLPGELVDTCRRLLGADRREG